MEIVKFAVVGYGHIGKRHIAMISGHKEAKLVAVVDIDNEKIKEAQQNEKVEVFSDYKSLLSSDIEIDVINICTPNGHHSDQAKDALARKCNVVVEKPMGLTKVGCESVIHKALNVSKHVFCVKQNRYSPTSVWLKNLIDKEILGKVFMVQLNCYWNRDDRYYSKAAKWKGTKALDGGVLFTQFSHFVDIMYWLFGDISNIRSRMANYTHENSTEFDDTGIVSFDFVNGGMGSLNFTTSIYGANMESSIAIIGEKGSVKVSGQYMDQVSYCLIKDYEMPELPPANPPNDYGDYKGSAANHHYVIDNVIDVLKGRSTISTNALEGMKVVEMIERIYQEA